jgi:4-amino-4-deoxy-L-arabinose transferase-like glycosyltransferase
LVKVSKIRSDGNAYIYAIHPPDLIMQMDSTLYKNRYVLLFFLLFLHLAAWVALKPVWPSSDDLQYSLQALRFHVTGFHPDYGQFVNRPGVYIPAAFLIRLFGMNPWVISLWPLLISLATITIVFFVLSETVNLKTAFLGGFLMATNIFQISWAAELFPDLIVSFFGLTAVTALWLGRRSSEKRNVFLFLYSTALVIGFFCKESILLLVPFIGLVCLLDLVRGKNVDFWLRCLGCTFLAVCFVSLVYYVATGDAFHRFRSMYDFSRNHLIDRDGENYIRSGAPSGLLEWLIYQLGYVFLFVFSIPAFLWIRKTEFSFLNFILFYSVVLFAENALLFQTGKFGIVFMQPRLWMFLIPSLSVVVAGVICQADRKTMVIVFAVLVFLCAYAYMHTGLKRMILFAMFTLAVAIDGLVISTSRKSIFGILVCFMILGGTFVYSNSSWGKYKRARGTELILPGKFPISERHIQIEILFHSVFFLNITR